MVTELLIVWIVGVVAFFALWAILVKVVQRSSERKKHEKGAAEDESSEKENTIDQTQ